MTDNVVVYPIPPISFGGRDGIYCFTLLEVLLSMIVLPAAQVLSQSSVGIDSRSEGKDSVENSLPDCGAGVSSLAELIASVINDGNVRFTSDINAGNLRPACH